VRLRFPLSGLMAAILLVGVIFAAAILAGPRYLEELAALAFSVVVLASLCTAILGVVLLRWQRQVFWIGYAVFGWALFLLCFFIQPARSYSFIFVGTPPFGYIGGLIARGFAARGDEPAP
jgi:hypothetical protein